MDILNKEISFDLLGNMASVGTITIINGAYILLSNEKRYDGLTIANNKYKYGLWLCNVTPEQDIDYVIRDWRIQNIRFTRKMNHEV